MLDENHIFFKWLLQTIINVIYPKKSLSIIFLCLIDVLWRLSGENKIWHEKIIYQNMSLLDRFALNNECFSTFMSNLIKNNIFGLNKLFTLLSFVDTYYLFNLNVLKVNSRKVNFVKILPSESNEPCEKSQ